VLRTVRAGKSETLRTLVLTGLTGEEPERAGALGADAYLVKPVSADVVVETVRSLLAKQ
jgi:DNA-binding response OmpR family regulator